MGFDRTGIIRSDTAFIHFLSLFDLCVTHRTVAYYFPLGLFIHSWEHLRGFSSHYSRFWVNAGLNSAPEPDNSGFERKTLIRSKNEDKKPDTATG